MKKILLLCVIIFTLVIMFGCTTEGEYRCGIDMDNNAYVNIELSIDAADLNANQRCILLDNIQEIVKYYRDELGFECERDYYADSPYKLWVKFDLVRPCTSFEAALEELKSILSDPALSPFTTADLEYVSSLGEYTYRVDATADVHRVVDNISKSGLPEGAVNYIKKSLYFCDLDIVIAMPDDMVKVDASFEDPTELGLTGRVKTKDSKVSVDTAPPVDKVLLWVIVGSTALAVCSLVLIIISIKRVKK